MGYLQFRRGLLNRLLFKACKKNKIGLVKFFIFWGANKDIKYRDLNYLGDEKTLIQIAYENDAFGVANYLISKASRIDKNELERAISIGSLDIVKSLIKKVDERYVNTVTDSGYTPFAFACFKNERNIVNYLLDLKGKGFLNIDIDMININKVNALMLACKNGNLNIVNRLLAQNAKLTEMNNGKEIIIKDNRGRTPLTYLAECKKCEVYQDKNIKQTIDYFLEREQSLLNEKDYLRKTPLIYAVENGNIRLVEYLIEKGAMIDEIDNNGNNALYYAVKNGHFEILKYLVDRKVDLDNINTLGYTSLMYAIEQKNMSMIKYLIENGANVNIENKEVLQTALMCAIRSKDKDIVKYLVEKGADIYRECNSKTSLMYAIEHGNREIVQILVEGHFNKYIEGNNDEYLTYEDKNRDNIFIYAIRSKDRKLINFLVNTNVFDVKAQNGKSELIDDYEDVIDLFDYLKSKGIVLEKSVVLDFASKKIDFKKLVSDCGLVKDYDIRLIENIYKFIKVINKSMKKVINDGNEKTCIRDSEMCKDLDNDVKNRQVNFSRVKFNEKLEMGFLTKIKKGLRGIKYFLKVPYVGYVRLLDKLLIRACKSNKKYLVNIAIFLGADINMKNESHNIIAKGVCESKNLDMLNFLIYKGLDLKREDMIGKTAVHYAIMSGDVDVLSRVIDRVGEEYIVNAKIFNETYLTYAVKMKSVEIVDKLIKIGSHIDVDVILECIHIAHKGITKCLLDNINDINDIGNIRKISEFVADFEAYDKEVFNDNIKLLIEKGMYVKEENKKKLLDKMFEKELKKVDINLSRSGGRARALKEEKKKITVEKNNISKL